MFLNIMIQGAKTWKPYWVEVKDNFINISADNGKEPFVSYHIGVLKVRPTNNYADRPDVLEFYDGDGFTSVSFFVFTYDPFDILDFFNQVCFAYKSWRESVATDRQPIKGYQCSNIKVPGIFTGNTTWQLESDRINILKSNAIQNTINLKDMKITPLWKGGAFKLQITSTGNETEYKLDNQHMRELLDKIYKNAFILKLPNQQPTATPEATPTEVKQNPPATE
ncbi:hypothetical protein GPJ56_001502 [Histomonas meleagridis]|uniref:uncharacterized protein n=1 Tax=Histomonas meleagridis TaxID=135588 RepID=UPI003559D146|nr:hypothetical protein GPJ56_001502 [Histomonas meleagridis]KAH0807008.1 hypothetical protein GO595_000184 [Histomonas meleagridis]